MIEYKKLLDSLNEWSVQDLELLKECKRKRKNVNNILDKTEKEIILKSFQLDLYRRYDKFIIDIIGILYLIDDKDITYIANLFNKKYNAIAYQIHDHCFRKTKKWTEQQVNYVYNNYKTEEISLIAKKLNRTVKEVYEKAHSLNITKNKKNNLIKNKKQKIQEKYNIDYEYLLKEYEDMII